VALAQQIFVRRCFFVRSEFIIYNNDLRHDPKQRCGLPGDRVADL
jgi:hypothetical protein